MSTLIKKINEACEDASLQTRKLNIFSLELDQQIPKQRSEAKATNSLFDHPTEAIMYLFQPLWNIKQAIFTFVFIKHHNPVTEHHSILLSKVLQVKDMLHEQGLSNDPTGGSQPYSLP